MVSLYTNSSLKVSTVNQHRGFYCQICSALHHGTADQTTPVLNMPTGREGIEPSSSVLETAALPLSYQPVSPLPPFTGRISPELSWVMTPKICYCFLVVLQPKRSCSGLSYAIHGSQ